MKIDLLEGRDFRGDDQFPNVAVVNATFARRYFGGESPVGRSFETIAGGGLTGRPGPSTRVKVRIIGVAGDARLEDMRLPVPATAYLPFRALSGGAERTYDRATFLVRTRTSDPMSLASMLRREVTTALPETRVANVVTQQELVRSQLIRERMLAALSLFFAAVALILAAVGLYGVLDSIVLERRRELGIRIALGATTADIVRLVTFGAVVMVVLGSAIGLGFGLAAERYVAALLYEITFTDPRALTLPLITVVCAGVLASLLPVLRAVRTNPAVLLRSE
jgi:ABC-type lipoprotein release transport system permease subunit